MRANYLMFFVVSFLLFSCVEQKQRKMIMELSNEEVIMLKEAFFKYDFTSDYATNDSMLLMLREKLDSIKPDEPSKKEIEELKVYLFKWVSDSRGVFFIYHGVPSLFGGYEGVVAHVRYAPEKFAVLPNTSKVFSSTSEKEILEQGLRVFNESLKE